MLKIVLSIIFLITMIPSSLAAMVYGWGIDPVHWGWIAQAYVVALVIPFFIGLIPD